MIRIIRSKVIYSNEHLLDVRCEIVYTLPYGAVIIDENTELKIMPFDEKTESELNHLWG